MQKTPGEKLRAARIARGFQTAAEAARHFGWSEVTYTSHENGTRGLRPDSARKYALAFGIAASELLGLTKATEHFAADSRLQITGLAAWGVWRDMDIASGPKSFGEIAVPSTNGSESRRALRVTDESVNQAIKPDGVAIYRPLDQVQPEDLKVGALVVVQREQGQLAELTIRRVRSIDDDHVIVIPHSTDPRFRGALRVPLNPQDDTCRIIGQVVAKYAEL